jgi:hypothetical protein
MTSNSDPVLTMDEIRYIKWMVKVAKAVLGSMVKEFGAPAPAANGAGKPFTKGAVASVGDLEGRFGNPKVRRDPKRWAGDSYVGALYSECPSDYLLVLAESLEYFAEKDSKKPDAKMHNNGTFYWRYDMQNAALARGWSSQNRGKTLPPPQASSSTQSDADEMASQAPSHSDEWEPAP